MNNYNYDAMQWNRIKNTYIAVEEGTCVKFLLDTFNSSPTLKKTLNEMAFIKDLIIFNGKRL